MTSPSDRHRASYTEAHKKVGQMYLDAADLSEDRILETLKRVAAREKAAERRRQLGLPPEEYPPEEYPPEDSLPKAR